MNIKPTEATMVVRAPRTVSNGLIVSQEAFIELDACHMRADFLQFFQHYYERGMIRVRVAEVKGKS